MKFFAAMNFIHNYNPIKFESDSYHQKDEIDFDNKMQNRYWNENFDAYYMVTKYMSVKQCLCVVMDDVQIHDIMLGRMSHTHNNYANWFDSKNGVIINKV